MNNKNYCDTCKHKFSSYCMIQIMENDYSCYEKDENKGDDK